MGASVRTGRGSDPAGRSCEALALGRYYVLIDTGGFDPDSDDPLKQSIALQVRIALEEADVVICVLDATTAPLPADREAVALLRGSSLPVLYVANKADNPRAQGEALEHYELGMDSLMPISALHGHGIGDLEEALVALFPPEAEVASEEEEDMLDLAPGLTGTSRLACQSVPDGSEDVVVEIPAWNRNLSREGGH